jgi:hypothetical protein
MKKCIVHLGSAHGKAPPARPSGPAPLGVSAHGRQNRVGEIPLVADGSPTKFGRPAATGRWGSGLGASPGNSDPDLGRGTVGGSPELGHDGDGGRAEGCTGEGVGWLSLARLVRSVSTSELGRCYWRDRRWPVKQRKRQPVTS